MAKIRLITPEEYASLRDTSKKLNADKINDAIDVAQLSDLQDDLGDFYFDLLENYEEDEYSELMEGSFFEYKGERYRHEGIKAVLADYVHARMIFSGNTEFTAFGIVQKESENSKPVYQEHLNRISKQAQIDGGNKFKFVDLYLRANEDKFKRYSRCKGYTSRNDSFNSIKISKL